MAFQTSINKILILSAVTIFVILTCIVPPACAGSISGRVTDTMGNGLPGVGFLACSPTNNICFASLGLKSDLNGHYSIESLPAGSYRVRASGIGVYAGEYYQDAYDPELATPVTVAADGDTPGIDFTLEVGGSISGTVTDRATGLPISGIPVSASPFSVMGGFAQTDVNGHYAITVLPPGGYKVSVNVSGTPYAHPAILPFVQVTSGNEIIGIDFSLDIGGSISGTVTDSLTGLPRAGITIYAFDSTMSVSGFASTDSNGRYAITGLGTGDYTVSVGASRTNHPGQQYPTLVHVTLGTGTSGIDFVLEPPGSISGRVTDTTGIPISGVRLTACPAPASPFELPCAVIGPGIITDLTGNYAITGLHEGIYSVYAEGIGNYVSEYYQDIYNWFNATPVAVTSGVDTPGINFTLELGGSISGTVADCTTGLPISGISVNTSGRGDRTDINGYYTITGLRAGSYQVSVNVSGTPYVRPAILPFVQVTSGNGTTGINFSLDIGGSISGTVTDSLTGLPIEDITISAHDSSRSYSGSALTDAYGHYFISGLGTGNYTVSASASGTNYLGEQYRTLVHVTLGTVTSGVDFSLKLAGSISGRVTDPLGKGLSGVQVSACPIGVYCGVVGPGIITDLNGNYSITGLHEGSYSVYAKGIDNYMGEYYQDAYGRFNATPVMVISGMDTAGIDFTLEIGGSISGTVKGASGKGLSGVRVDACNISEDACGRAMAAPGICPETTSFADGSFSITKLPRGSYWVRAYGTAVYLGEFYKKSNDGRTATSVSVTPGIDTPGIDFTLEAGGSISGTVSDANGQPIPGISVHASPYVDGPNGIVQSDSSGKYTITPLPEGDYRISVRASGTQYVDEEYPTSVQVTTGNETDGIDFIIDVGGSISGKVTDISGNGIMGILVSACSLTVNTRYCRNGFSDMDGNYSIVGLAESSYSVYAGGELYAGKYYQDSYGRQSATPVPVFPGADTSGIDFILEIGGSISGTVTDSLSGLGIPSASIVVSNNAGVASGLLSTDYSGHFSISGLPTGNTYQVTVNASCKYQGQVKNNILVIAPDMTIVDFSLIPSKHLKSKKKPKKWNNNNRL